MTIAETEHPAASSPARPSRAGTSPIDLAWLSEKIPYRRYQECVHCGLCTASCPTYIETCDENDSPRGRIYLMRAVADGRLAMGPGVREHLELCLDCRACESACPSGVQYGKMIEPFKIALQSSAEGNEKASWLERLILHHLFPYSSRVRWALAPARWLQKLGLLDWAERIGLTRLLPPTLRRMQAMLPKLSGSRRRLPEVLPAIGPKRARVALFLGCVADAMFPETNAATARVLQENGCEVVIPRGQVCCGAIHYHSGVEQPALELARTEPGGLWRSPARRDHRQRRRLRGHAQGLCAYPSRGIARPGGSGLSRRSKTSPSSWWLWGRFRRAGRFRSRWPITTPATSATASRFAASPGPCSR